MKLSRLFLVAGLVILLDQVVKLAVYHYMVPGERIALAGDWAYLFYVHNPGMAYGLEFGGSAGKIGLSFIRILAGAALVWLIVRLHAQRAPRIILFLLALLLGGAVGNVIDSVFYGLWLEGNAMPGALFGLLHGQVIDMFYFPLVSGVFPEWVPIWGGEDFLFFRFIFNVADAAISLAFFGLVLSHKRLFAQFKDPEVTTSPVESNPVSSTTPPPHG